MQFAKRRGSRPVTPQTAAFTMVEVSVARRAERRELGMPKLSFRRPSAGTIARGSSGERLETLRARGGFE